MNTRAVRAFAIAASAALLFAFLPIKSGAATLRPSSQRAASTYQWGINTLVNDDCTAESTWQSWATTQVKAFKALGANSIAIGIPFYTDSWTSNNFYAELDCVGGFYTTPPPSYVADIVTIAHAYGMQVLIRPLLDQASLVADNKWRGQIEPTDPKLWFTNYFNTLQPYLVMAQQYGVEHFSIATELDSMLHYPYWAQVIANAKRIYTGDLVFTGLWAPGGEKRFPGTSPGIDTYVGIQHMPITATPSQLLAGWNKALKTFDALPYMSTETIDEVTIPAQQGAYTYPYIFDVPYSQQPFDQTIQANWFTMVCRFVKSHHLGGVYFWGPSIFEFAGGLPTSPDTKVSYNIQPASQKVLHNCFTT